MDDGTDDQSHRSKWTFKPNKWYEFTINFNDRYQNNNKTHLVNRYDISRKRIHKILTDNDYYDFYLLPEISQPQYGDEYKNTIPRIHYHGLFRFKDNNSILMFLLETSYLLAHIGRYQFNEYRPDHWPDYCMKQSDIFKQLTPYELKSMANFKWPNTA